MNALRHDQACPDYNPSFRQLIHVAYKVAYELNDEYLCALDEHRETVAQNVKKTCWSATSFRYLAPHPTRQQTC